MFGPGLVCDRFQFIQPLPDFVGHRALGPSHVAVDQKEGGEQLWITVVDPPLIPEPAAKSEYVSRARQLTSMRHPSLVRTRAVTDDDQRVFIAYEALPGALVLEDIMTRFGAMSSTLVLERARSVARGLDALHRRGVVHGGLDGTTVVNWEEQCLLLNYGLFPALHADRFRELARRTGSVAMWPPEVVRGEFTPAADVFAWGVLVAQMLTGEAAAAAVIELDDHARKYDVGSEFLELIRSCTHTDPAERPRDATHLVARLENFDSITSGRVDEVSDAVELPPPPSEMGAELSLNFVGGSGTSTESVAADDEDGMISMTEISLETANPDLDSSPALELPDTPEDAPARSKPPRKRPAQPTAKLSALAAEIVGEDGVGELGSVFDGEVPREPDASVSSMDLEKLALGVEAAAGSEASLSLIGGGDPTDFDTFATRNTEEPERTPEDPEIKVDRGKKIKLRMPRRTRRPGPHGPPPNLVSRGIIVATGTMTFLFTLHVAGERGGYAALVDPAFSQELSTTVDTAFEVAKDAASSVAKMGGGAPSMAAGTTGASGGADTTGGDTQSGAAGDAGDTTGGDTTAAEVEVPPVYRPCEKDTLAISETVCIDIAEYPGRKKIPRTNISFLGAEEACDRRGARLCSIEEWQSACEGEAGNRYPYGNVVDPYACNTASPAGYPQDIRRSGSTSNCVTPGGVYDLIGNVGEWVSDGRAVGGDSTTPHKAVHCGKWGSPPRGFASDLLGFRCCVDRLVE